MKNGIFVNKQHLLDYDFSFCKGSLESIAPNIATEMKKLGCDFPTVPPYKNGKAFGDPNGYIAVSCEGNIYFTLKPGIKITAEKIKKALDSVKETYEKVSKKLKIC